MNETGAAKKIDLLTKLVEEISNKNFTPLFYSILKTKLGPMIVITDNHAVYLLEFVDRKGLESEIHNFKKRLKAKILPRKISIVNELEHELNEYFSTGKSIFTVPIKMTGTNFQIKVWQELQKIPTGETISYQELAVRIGNKNASRAVARANSTNKIALIIPCHRVINSNGNIGGYAGGIERKKWLLVNEK
ncbi:methylated-DNA--[protein]-cysteine S-methyltransferase [Xylocopilactobacillus apis]|uniref:methylated-DNA--[protein]-cysteine S-methyltransferase n=1 Tax=Xylocopilactobacillus apis TaxID=2932183 RepID=A0AAU9DJ25_9LACO|nr:methylated-DNA--[protein]-cysteine S-methyltransferase [Xylocopilactobacillus apis]BDR56802.1 hypothetical protein KIMC2_13640 [Xylocopilactobacillus apis]